jgi:hypothetical protein
MANPDADIMERFLRYSDRVHGVKCFLDTALTQNWARIKFGAAYIDLCTSSSEVVLSNLSTLIPRMEQHSAIGFTYTARDGAGESVLQRYVKIEKFLCGHGYSMCSDGLREFRPSGVYTCFFSRTAATALSKKRSQSTRHIRKAAEDDGDAA